MSLNAIHRNVMIFSDSQEKAEKKMYELVCELNEDVVVRKKDYIKTVNNTFEARKFIESCRGFRYMDVYVDESLKDDSETMRLIMMKLVPPYYYNNNKYDDDYNWRNHIYFYEG